MDKKILGAILLIVGIAIMFESLFADFIGIGSGTIFGPNQFIGTIVGVIMTGSGLFLMFKDK